MFSSKITLAIHLKRNAEVSEIDLKKMISNATDIPYDNFNLCDVHGKALSKKIVTDFKVHDIIAKLTIRGG